MPDYYFTKIPFIEYNGQACRDISRSVRYTEQIEKTRVHMYPYDLPSGMRPDVLSDLYYQDSYQEWLIYMANGITDPYYDWYLSEDDFMKFIIAKYGSIENAQTRVSHYVNAWADDQTELTVKAYNALTQQLKKYYTPDFGYGTSVISYKRRKINWIANTNRLVKIEFDNSNGDVDTLDTIYYSDDETKRGELVSYDDTSITLKNLVGEFTTSDTIKGNEITKVTVLSITIPIDEYMYWKPVSYFDKEMTANEVNKRVYLIDAGQALTTSDYVRSILSE